MGNTYDITVLIVTYNSEYEDLVATLDSTLMQQGISIQIVIADDGSENNNFDRVTQYFAERDYRDYELVANENNQGTVKNIISGMDVSTGEYVKTISPGDYFDNEYTIADWVRGIRKSGRKWSFSDAVFYVVHSDGKSVLKGKHNPMILKPYIKNDDRECIWNYLVLEDGALGAATMSHTDTFRRYLDMINDKVVYAEDMAFRLMMYDNLLPYYYRKDAVWYEYGGGISTSGSDKWRIRLQKDMDSADEILCLRKADNTFQEKILRELRFKKEPDRLKRILHKVFQHGKVKMAITARRMSDR